MSRGTEIVARARALIGTRFRPQGRSRETGLDCIGLVAAAVAAGRARSDYALRGGSIGELEAELAGTGMRRIDQAPPGSVLVMRSGPEQLHLGIWTGSGLVHADAALRRIVERPGPPPWTVLSCWYSEN